jgi:hypothetical protein
LDNYSAIIIFAAKARHIKVEFDGHQMILPEIEEEAA